MNTRKTEAPGQIQAGTFRVKPGIRAWPHG